MYAIRSYYGFCGDPEEHFIGFITILIRGFAVQSIDPDQVKTNFGVTGSDKFEPFLYCFCRQLGPGHGTGTGIV